jgi:23S rRNA (cytidine1920-2'-O)/16S rRNA (cytidine1409-2'-O)-methyltransferase
MQGLPECRESAATFEASHDPSQDTVCNDDHDEDDEHGVVRLDPTLEEARHGLHGSVPEMSGEERDRERIDRLIVERGLCDTRSRAQALIVAGKVVVGEQRVDKPGTLVRTDAPIRLLAQDHPYVSRGGVKLRGALDHFAERGLGVVGRRAMDVGASTGGFTDCLLQAGVSEVHAVDVGYGQLAWRLASDERVHVHDRQNIRTLELERIGELVDLVVVDCSFIALAKVIPHIPAFLTPEADVIALVKPQFELEPSRVGKGGVVRDPADHVEAVDRASTAATTVGFVERDRTESPIAGRDGNREFFLWLHWQGGRS